MTSGKHLHLNCCVPWGMSVLNKHRVVYCCKCGCCEVQEFQTLLPILQLFWGILLAARACGSVRRWGSGGRFPTLTPKNSWWYQPKYWHTWSLGQVGISTESHRGVGKKGHCRSSDYGCWLQTGVASIGQGLCSLSPPEIVSFQLCGWHTHNFS